jgi:aryl-alcohol dehydrogenase-like predicted oxidoreductase
MQYVAFGEKQASRLGFGCGSVMGRVGRAESLRAMSAAWDAGVTLFDTARSYGYGEAEGLLGEFLVGKRERAVVVTKFGILPSRTAGWKRMLKPVVRGALRAAPGLREAVRSQVGGAMSAGHFDVATLRASLEASLRALRTEYVDALLMHEAPASVMQQEDLMAELEKVVSEGKARRVGIASGGMDVARVAMIGPTVLSVLQYPAMGITSWAEGGTEERIRIANHPLGGAIVAKRVGNMLLKMAGDARIRMELREKLRGTSEELVAAYCFTRVTLQSRPHCIVTSMLKMEHLRANVAAMGSVRFSAEEIAVMSRMVAEA